MAVIAPPRDVLLASDGPTAEAPGGGTVACFAVRADGELVLLRTLPLPGAATAPTAGRLPQVPPAADPQLPSSGGPGRRATVVA